MILIFFFFFWILIFLMWMLGMEERLFYLEIRILEGIQKRGVKRKGGWLKFLTRGGVREERKDKERK